MNLILIILFFLSTCCVSAQGQWGSVRNCREINSVADDFAPVWNATQRLLYLNSERSGRSVFYIASQNSPNQFSPPALLESPLNARRGNQSYLTVSSNGSAYLSAFTMGEKRSYLSIYQSEFQGSSWKPPIPVEELADESFSSHPTVSDDGRTLIYSSTRAGGIGGIDLWQSRKQSDGKWSQPLNLGESLNSPGNEITPFLSGDSLYFSSDGWGGKGGYELFLSVKNAGVWQAPIPLTELNSDADETDFTLLDHQSALFASNRDGGIGGIDIYQTYLERENQSQSSTPLEMIISTLVPNIVVKESFIKRSIALLPVLFFTQNSDALPDELQPKPKDISQNTTQLPKDSLYLNTLNLIGLRMKSCKDCILTITGWADKLTRLENSELARRRAEKVKNYMATSFGIDEQRLLVKASVMADTSTLEKQKGLYARVDIQSNTPELFEPIEYQQGKRSVIPSTLECIVDARPRQNVRSWSHSIAGINTLESSVKLPSQFSINSRDLLNLCSGDSLVLTAYGLDSTGKTATQTIVLPIQHTRTAFGQATEPGYLLSTFDPFKAADRFEEIVLDGNRIDDNTHETSILSVLLTPFIDAKGKIHPLTKTTLDEIKSRANKHNIKINIIPRKDRTLPPALSNYEPYILSIILETREP